MYMTRMDMEPEHCRGRGFTEVWAQPAHPVLSHSPFHDCTQGNASFGNVIACTPWSELTDDCADSPRNGGGIESLAALFADDVIAQALDLELGLPGAEMPPSRRELVLQNPARAHSNLITGSLTWPMIKRLAAEVGFCRELVDSTGDGVR